MSTDFNSSDPLDAILDEIKHFGLSGKGEPTGSSAAVPAHSSAPSVAPAVSDGWSLEDIDRLLADTELPASAPAPKKQVTEAPPAKKPVHFPSEDVPVSTYFKRTETPAPATVPAKPVSTPPVEADDDIDKIILGALEDRRSSAMAALMGKSAPAAEPASEPVPTPEPVREYVPVPPEPVSDEAPVESYEPSHAKSGSEDDKTKEVRLPSSADGEHIPDYDPLADYESRRTPTPMDTDRNRADFMAAPVEEPPAEPEPEEPADGPVDRPGIVIDKKHSSGAGEPGLAPLPTVMSADTALDGDKSPTKTIPVSDKPASAVTPATVHKEESEETPGQIMLSGFEEVEEEQKPETVSEKILEHDFSVERKKKVSEFVLDKDTISDEPVTIERPSKKELRRKKEEEKEKNDARLHEYNDRSERKAVHISLKKAAHDKSVSMIITAVLVAALLVLELINIFGTPSVTSSMFGVGTPGNYMLSAVILIAVMAVNSSTITSGINRLKKKKPDASTAVMFSATVAFVHNTVIAVAGANNTAVLPIFSAVAGAGFFIYTLSGRLNAERILRSFELTAYKYEDGVYNVHSLRNEEDVREISRGLLMDSPDLLYSSKAIFPANYIKNSRNTYAERRTTGLVLPAAAVASVITAVLCGVLSKNLFSAYTVFTGTFCLCAPVMAAFAPALATRIVNRELNREGTVITGSNIAENINAANAVVIDASDIFDRSHCIMHGMIDFKQIRIDDVLVYAAALVIKSGGPLRESFENVISRDFNILPQVSELKYEDKLGISARIRSQKVLLGNRTLLANHNVDVPDKSVENRHASDGKRVIYLAVDGCCAAMFVVSYAVDSNLRDYLHRLEATGTQVLVRTNDVNVTEEMLARGFGLPKSTFCILGSAGGRRFIRRRDEVTERTSASIIHDGSASTMLRAVSAAQQLYRNLNVSFVAQMLLSCVGFVLAAIATGVSAVSAINGVTGTLFLALSCALLSVLTGLLNKKL